MNVSKRTAKLFLQGDEDATSEVYYAYRKLLFFIISNYVDGEQDREDVYQEVFAKVFEHRCDCAKAEGLHYYLCQVAKTTAIDFGRKKSNKIYEPFEEETVPSSGDSNLDSYLDQFSLDPDERAIAGYRFGFGLSWKEIVDLTGIPMSTAKLRCKQALGKIKKELEK
ncbi:MAG: sigma-70 family RNA polymerase sigma factor [Bacilli bacterium]|nr:sigma-70 family RNA polymerase sigma factor [Bacilli bacterium]